ncbi:MAG: three-Cys-motif partner protein TcmP [Planctomycetota bacterium]|jgi:spore photoproduct lyase
MLKNSSPEKWEYREHTRVKHILLKKYLAAWISILGKRNPRICYFDGFAGRGEYRDGTLGSPLIALKVADGLSKYYGKLFCIFIEKNGGNFRNLETVLNREKTNIKNLGKIKIIKENDEFSNVIEAIFHNLEKEESILAPSFFFVDPFGFSGIPFSIIKKILSNPKTEVFFTFMVRDIARFTGLPEIECTFNSLFGTDKWKRILSSSKKPEIALIDLYREQLHEVSRVKYSWPFRICTSQKVQTLYYLLHVTNNYKGHSIMKGIMYNQSAQGDFAYLGPEDIASRSQMRLFNINNIGELKKYVLEKFRDETLTYDDVQEKACHPWYSEPPYIDKHFRQALKELENEHKIKVDRVTSKTERGLSKKDIITFPKSNPVQMTSASSIPTTVSKIKIHYKEYQELTGRREILVERVNDGSIITRFDKTPLPKSKTDVVCPHFLELKWAYGCPYNCAWCYLKGTFRFHPKGKLPVVKPYEKIERHTKKFLEEVKTPEILNAGEIADSLMHEDDNFPFSKFIIPFFEKQNRHKVLFLTKSSNVNNLLEIQPHKQIIISFSLNALPVAKRWEKAPSVLKRIEAAKKVSDAGYEVRIRIDPMVPIENWQKHYVQLLDILFDNITPERITLGSLRGLQSTINGCSDKSWVKYLRESSNWGKKIDFNSRHDMYQTIIEQLKSKYHFKNAALCKETVEMWNALKIDYKKISCNCIW